MSIVRIADLIEIWEIEPMRLEDCTKEELILVLRAHCVSITAVYEAAILSHRAEKAGKRATEFLEKSIELLELGDLEASNVAYKKYIELRHKEDKIIKEIERLVL